MTPDTIVAMATPPGRGGVAVLRVSGPLVNQVIQFILKKSLTPRVANLTHFYGLNNEIIDHGIAILFPNPHSFTGDDVLELHTHGSPVVTDWLIETILSTGARLARAGEFSMRAFLNGKMDLTKAEAIADLIDSTSRSAAQCALRSLQGEFSNQIHKLVAGLITLRIQVEAAIDFSDEDIHFSADQEMIEALSQLMQQLKQITQKATEGSRLREGITVVIVGRPNAGKSSLLNRLSGRSSAIVTNIPGTTRDVLRESILVDGLSIQLIDTAGLRLDSEDPIEQEGIRRAKLELETADIMLYVYDARLNEDSIDDSVQSFSGKTVLVRNKIDLLNEEPGLDSSNGRFPRVSLSAETGQGIDQLIQIIREISGVTDTEGLFYARRRHLDALNRAVILLNSAYTELLNQRTLDCVAEDLRLAQLAFSEITGEFSSDDLLGEIFSSFCIGK